MTITNVIDHVDGTGADVTIVKLDEATFTHYGTEVLPLGTRSKWVISNGDDLHKAFVTVTTKLDPNGLGGSGQRSVTFSFSTWARSTDSTTNVTLVAPVNCMLAINLPANIPMDVADVRTLLEVLYSLTYATVTTKVPENNRLSAAALFGLSEVL